MPRNLSLLSLNIPKDVLSALMRKGYESVQDLTSTNPDALSKDLEITLQQAEDIINRCQNTHIPTSSIPMTQSASNMMEQCEHIKTGCTGLDFVLDGGLKRGRILEISGPPGSPKEKLLIEIVSLFAKAKEGVLFVDCENMTSPATLSRSLQDVNSKVGYFGIQSLPQFFLFLHQLPEILKCWKSSLLVINSISFLFQSPDIISFRRGAYLDFMKSSFARLCASGSLTIITSSQLSTKMVNADGSRGSFDSGGRGIVLPQLGPSYLPTTKSHRVLLWPNDPMSGVIKLLSAPKYPPGKVPQIVGEYSIVRGNIV